MHEIVDYNRKVSVFHTTLNTDNKFLESKIDAEQKRDPMGDAKRAVQAWRTDTYLHFRDKEYTPLLRAIGEVVGNVSKEEYGLPVKYVPLNFWACSYKEGEFAHKHNHWQSVFYGTYYVNVGDNPSPIVFEGVTHITPSDGSLMIWPGYLDHEVPPSSSVRKLFSFNFEVMVGSGPNKPMKNRF